MRTDDFELNRSQSQQFSVCKYESNKRFRLFNESTKKHYLRALQRHLGGKFRTDQILNSDGIKKIFRDKIGAHNPVNDFRNCARKKHDYMVTFFAKFVIN